jgi:uncharacterized Zn finger protein
MPAEIEQAFRDAKVSLFPERPGDLKTDCSCPDWSSLCKHIGAVYCLLGEEFDRDPFLIFQMRGMTREDFLAALGQSIPAAAPEEPPEPLPNAAALRGPGPTRRRRGAAAPARSVSVFGVATPTWCKRWNPSMRGPPAARCRS